MAPTILFVPGAWHSTVHFVPVRSLLRAHGYATSCPSMPSYGGAAECTRQDDVDVVKAELERLLAEGADVILAGHSYGGMVATEAALAEYSKAARAEKALAGGVIHILYLSALVVQPGMTLFELRVEGAPHRAKFVIDTATSTCRIDNPGEIFYNDIPHDEQARWVSELKPMPLHPLHEPLTYAGYLHHPSTYLHCTDDQSLVLPRQELAVKLAREAGANMNTRACNASHSSYLSQPETVLKVIDDICQGK